MTFISQIFDFRIISESLNLGTSTRAVYKAYCNSLFSRTLFSRGNEFANISKNSRENFQIYSISQSYFAVAIHLVKTMCYGNLRPSVD